MKEGKDMARVPDTYFYQMLVQAKTGHPEALDCLCRQFYPTIFKYVTYHVPSLMAAEDITQDIFEEMVQDIHKVRAKDEVAFRAWLFAIACTMVASYHRACYRTKERMTTVTLEAAGDVFSPDDPTQPLETQERISALIEELKRLSTEKRNIVVSRAQGQKFAAIATQLGRSEKAVQMIDSRTRYAMKHRLEMIIAVAFVTCSLMLIGGYIALSQARPGNPFYPVKQWVMPAASTPMPTPIPYVGPQPTIAPLPTVTSSPTPTPSPTPQATPTEAPASVAPQQNNSPLPVNVPLKKQLCMQGVCL